MAKQWADAFIEQLDLGKAVSFRPRGNSMRPLIHSGDLCTVEPWRADLVAVGDVVLCTVHGRQYLHLVKAIANNCFQIGNNHGRINGWTTRIHGKLTDIEPCRVPDG